MTTQVRADSSPPALAGHLPREGGGVALLRRATLADVAPVARLSVQANGSAFRTSHPADLSAPELALRLLEELEAGVALYVADEGGRTVGFAQTGAPMIGDEGRLVELRSLCVAPDHDLSVVGRRLVRLALRDLGQRLGPVVLRAWAAAGSHEASVLRSAGGMPVGRRWGIGRAGATVRGVIYGWPGSAAFI